MPVLDRLHDRGEVVVGEGHGRRFLADVGPGDAHRDPDVGLLQGRGIVDAVAGHRHQVARVLERRDDLELVGRRDAREDVDLLELPREFGGRHPVELGAGDHPTAGQQAQLARDGLGRERVVAGDHDRLDARLAAQPHRLGGLRPGRVEHAHEAQEGHLGFGRCHGHAGFGGDGEDPQRLARHRLRGVQDGRALLLPQRYRA